MTQKIKRYGLIFVVLVILFSCLPLDAFAIDPMSTAMAANAFAQAVAAYGASQGAAMTFDVSTTDGLGEGVHELWTQFRESNSESDDFNDVATLFTNSNPYGPSSINVAGQTLQVIGVNIDEDIKPLLDDFWTWLLSGPAEMTKVDNQYFEWAQAQIGPNAVPLSVLTFNGGPFPYLPYIDSDTANATNFNRLYYGVTSSNASHVFGSRTSGVSLSVFLYPSGDPGSYQYVFVSDSSFSAIVMNHFPAYGSYTRANITGPYQDVTTHLYYKQNPINVVDTTLPIYTSFADGMAAFSSEIADPTVNDIGVRGYGDSTVAEFPDTTDPNYDAIHPPIPMNIPWDDALYGDGTGTLTGTQTQAIAYDLTEALAEDGTVDLAEEGTGPSPPFVPPTDVLFPLIPINLPHFDFSLSGIWHYVREWVSSIGGFIALLFTTWSYLPYAIYVPVFASLVIVIVLGLYKRFFM